MEEQGRGILAFLPSRLSRCSSPIFKGLDKPKPRKGLFLHFLRHLNCSLASPHVLAQSEKPGIIFFPLKLQEILFLDFQGRLTLNTLSVFLPLFSLHSGGYSWRGPLNIARLAPNGTPLFCWEATLASLELNVSFHHNSRSRGEE